AATGPLVLFNGAMVWDMADRRPLHKRPLAMADALATIEIALAEAVHVNTYVDDEIWIARTTATSRRSEVKDGVRHRLVGDLVGQLRAGAKPPIKLMLIDEDRGVTRLIDSIRAALSDEYTLVNSEPAYLELMAPGVDKGSALTAVHEHCGIAPADIIAFGDQLNDVELIQRSGLGVAMGNAHTIVQQAADVVIGPNTEDSIARFLRDRFELRDGCLVVHT
ncbi:MAG: HAD hydrolase family protein, partial [Myxococcota bacterium]